jgi:hypothetical protein
MWTRGCTNTDEDCTHGLHVHDSDEDDSDEDCTRGLHVHDSDKDDSDKDCTRGLHVHDSDKDCIRQRSNVVAGSWNGGMQAPASTASISADGSGDGMLRCRDGSVAVWRDGGRREIATTTPRLVRDVLYKVYCRVMHMFVDYNKWCISDVLSPHLDSCKEITASSMKTAPRMHIHGPAMAMIKLGQQQEERSLSF